MCPWAGCFGDVEKMVHLVHLCKNHGKNGEFNEMDAKTRREEDTERMEQGSGCNFVIVLKRPGQEHGNTRAWQG